MSGGHFNDCGYDYYKVAQFADELEVHAWIIIQMDGMKLETVCETSICAKIVVLSHHRILGEETTTSAWC